MASKGVSFWQVALLSQRRSYSLELNVSWTWIVGQNWSLPAFLTLAAVEGTAVAVLALTRLVEEEDAAGRRRGEPVTGRPYTWGGGGGGSMSEDASLGLSCCVRDGMRWRCPR